MSKRVATICAAAAVLVLGAACQPAPLPPPPPPERVTFVATLERDIRVGHFWEKSHLVASPQCELRVIDRRFRLTPHSSYTLMGELVALDATLHAGSQIEFSVLDIPWCSSNTGTVYKGREYYGPPVSLRVAVSDFNPDEFVTVSYYDGLSIPK